MKVKIGFFAIEAKMTGGTFTPEVGREDSESFVPLESPLSAYQATNTASSDMGSDAIWSRDLESGIGDKKNCR